MLKTVWSWTGEEEEEGYRGWGDGRTQRRQGPRSQRWPGQGGGWERTRGQLLFPSLCVGRRLCAAR